MKQERITIIHAKTMSLTVRVLNRLADRTASRGATAVEYALIVALIAAVIIAAVGLLGTSTADNFQAPIDEMNNAGPA